MEGAWLEGVGLLKLRRLAKGSMDDLFMGSELKLMFIEFKELFDLWTGLDTLGGGWRAEENKGFGAENGWKGCWTVRETGLEAKGSKSLKPGDIGVDEGNDGDELAAGFGG